MRTLEAALVAALAELGIEAECAPRPTGVWVGDRKLCGILVETAPVGGRTAATIGIGVNVAQREFPIEIADTATSIALELGASPDTTRLAESLAEGVLDNYSQFLTHGFKEIVTRWRKYMWGVGLRVQINAEGSAFDGVIQGVDDDGALVVRDASGADRVIYAADTIKTSINRG